MADNKLGSTDNFGLQNRSVSSERKAPPCLDSNMPGSGRSASDSGEYRRASSAELAMNSSAKHKSSSSGEMRAVSSDSGSYAVPIPKLPNEAESAPEAKPAEEPEFDDTKVVKKDEDMTGDAYNKTGSASEPADFDNEDGDINAIDGIELFKDSLPHNSDNQKTLIINDAIDSESENHPEAAPEDPFSAAYSGSQTSEHVDSTAEYAITPLQEERVSRASDTAEEPAGNTANACSKSADENLQPDRATSTSAYRGEPSNAKEGIHNYSKSDYRKNINESDLIDDDKDISSDEDDHIDDNITRRPAGGASKRTGGTGRDLFIGLSYFILLLVLSGIALNYLLTWKNDLDIRPQVSYEQMIWSEKGDTLAFVRTETKHESTGTKQKSAVWTSDRFGEKIECLNKNIPSNCKLVGWFQDDSKIILSSPGKAPNASSVTQEEKSSEAASKAVSAQPLSLTPVSMENLMLNSREELSLIEIDIKSKQVNVLGSDSAGLQIVGSNKDKIFFADYSDTKKASGHINILSWQPGQASDNLKMTAALPSRQDEPLQVEQVTEAPDHSKLAIVISISKSGIKTENAAEDEENDTPLGVWIFNKNAERGENPLSWLNLASHKARDLRIIWAKDSQCLGGIAGHSDSVELFAYHSHNDCPAAKLHGLSEGEHITPLEFNSDSDEMTFASDHRVDKYNFYMKENKELLSAANLGIVPSNFVTSSKGAAAYTATVHNTQNIYICTLNNPNSSMVNITADTAKHTLFYRIVAQLEYAVNYWHNLVMAI
ncbi:hypothetical protein IJT93_00440 [bacterium]|nr:hypothetical protein [bacterium]